MRLRNRRRRVYLQAFLSLLPLILILLVLRVYPIAVAIGKSFTNWDGLFQNDWIGLQNYVEFVNSGPFLMIRGIPSSCC